MATVTLHRLAPSPTTDRPRLPPFWSSLINGAPAADAEPARPAAPAARKSSAIVGDLWIQIR